jgi:cell division protein FtsN
LTSTSSSTSSSTSTSTSTSTSIPASKSTSTPAVSTQTRTQTSTGNQSTTAQTRSQTTESSSNSKYIVPFANVDAGFYVVFGSFRERRNAERMLAILSNQYSNVVDIGNNNVFGMYRTGIGPYKTREDAASRKPKGVRTWILRINN